MSSRTAAAYHERKGGVQRYLFTDEEMQAVYTSITDDGEVAGLLTVWEIILGTPLADTVEPNIDPSLYAIPTEQWLEITGYMVRDKRTQHPSYEGIPGFTMVNQGPSSYEQEDA